jgi:hypothetical protein
MNFELVQLRESKYVIFIVITICWFIGTIGSAYYINVPQGSSKYFEVVKLAFLSIGAYGVITATYFTVQNSLESAKDVKAKIDFDKKQNSMKIIERWDHPVLKRARDFTRNMIDKHQQIGHFDLLDKINSDEKLKNSVITTFNFWETMYLAISYEYVNEKLLKTAFKETYFKMYVAFKIWIKDLEKGYPTMKENLDEFYKRWQEPKN